MGRLTASILVSEDTMATVLGAEKLGEYVNETLIEALARELAKELIGRALPSVISPIRLASQPDGAWGAMRFTATARVFGLPKAPVTPITQPISLRDALDTPCTPSLKTISYPPEWWW